MKGGRKIITLEELRGEKSRLLKDKWRKRGKTGYRMDYIAMEAKRLSMELGLCSMEGIMAVCYKRRCVSQNTDCGDK